MKRLLFLLGLLLAFATPDVAQTKFDTIYFEFELNEGIDSSTLYLRFSGGILQKGIGFEINNGKENIKPKYISTYNSFSVYGKGYVQIYTSAIAYSFDNNDFDNTTYDYIISPHFDNTGGTYMESEGAITSLDVSRCPNLKILKCWSYKFANDYAHSRLTSLDVSNCTALKQLDCHNNQLTSLDVSNNTALEYLDCYNNQLTSLDVSNNTALEYLDCYNNQLTSLDVSHNTALKQLDCRNNQLTSLDVSNNTRLKELECGSIRGSGIGNLLTSLDVSHHTALEKLDCSYGQLTSLNASGCSALKTIYCNSNQLSNLNVSGCSALTELSCSSNQLTSLDVSGCTALTELYCSSNQLTSLDVSGCTALTDLWCHMNQLTSLNVGGCTALETLNCYDNQLTTLDVRSCIALKELACGYTDFEWRYYYGNQLTNLDVSNNTALTTLRCSNNHITLYRLYNIYNQHSKCWLDFNPQSDTVALTINQPLDLSYEKALDGSLSSFNVTNEWGGEVSSDWYTENDFTFRFLKQGQYRLVIKNQRVKNSFDTIPVPFTWYISVVEDNNDDDVANESQEADRLRIYAQDRTIYLSENRGLVQVFNTLGQCVYSGIATAIPVKTGGLYIVRVGAHSHKVLVR